jgi:hypothetical protein
MPRGSLDGEGFAESVDLRPTPSLSIRKRSCEVQLAPALVLSPLVLTLLAELRKTLLHLGNHIVNASGELLNTVIETCV